MADASAWGRYVNLRLDFCWCEGCCCGFQLLRVHREITRAKVLEEAIIFRSNKWHRQFLPVITVHGP